MSEDEKFHLRNETISFESTITDVEDVSYVVSPYLPLVLRRVGGPVTSSNSHRAAESATKDSTIRDELDEVITVSNVTILVGEWVPFGVNQIVNLNMKLGSNDRCQGGFFSPEVDAESTNTQCEIPAGLTNVSILDHDTTSFTNIEAQVHYPEDDGIVQVEHFGIHLRKDGTVVHATKGLSNTSVGERVTVGHNVVLHGCTIGSDCLIGMGAIVLDNAIVGDGCIIGAGALILKDTVVPPGSLVLGNPARDFRTVTEKQKQAIEEGWRAYVRLANEYRGKAAP